jgi:site-specific DNA-cytosine methylase
MRIGSLCSGFGGLDLAVQSVFGGEVIWVCDPDPGCQAILTHRFPGVPNLGDIREVDWATVPPVDLLCAGFPCFAAGTMILTMRGYVPVETVTIADHVLTHKGRWQPVTSVITRDNAPLWRVNAPYPIITTPEHPFYTRTQEREWDNGRRCYRRVFSDPVWTPAARLTGASRVGYVLPPVRQPDQPDSVWWWLAGRYLADGWRQRRVRTGGGNPVTSDQGRVVIACGPGKEDELRKHLTVAGLHATEVPERAVIKFHILDQPFYQFCGRFGHGAAFKALPVEALSLPPDLAEQLLAGWLAGDGHQDADGWHGTTVSKTLALGMALIAHRARDVAASLTLRQTTPTKVIEGRTVNQRPWWRVSIPSRNRSVLIEGDRAWRRVTGSADIGVTGRVYNISVAGDESYIADGVIVHNCQPVSAAGRRKGVEDDRWLWEDITEVLRRMGTPPRLLCFENVPGLMSANSGDAIASVAGSLAALGYEYCWRVIRASEAGAPHRRARWFCLAWSPADPERGELQRRGIPGVLGSQEPASAGYLGTREIPAWEWQQRHGDTPADSGPAAPADPPGVSEREPDPQADTVPGDRGPREVPVVGGPASAIPESHRWHQGWPESAGEEGRQDAALHRDGPPAEPERQSGQRGDGQPLGQPEGRTPAGRDRQADDIVADSPDAGWETRGGDHGRTPSRPGDGPDPCPPGPDDSSADTDSPGLQGQQYDRAEVTAGGAKPGSLHGGTDIDWLQYGPAIRQWERVTGRLAPRPTEPGKTGERLSPRFVEWMQGLPDGWVTDVPGLTRNQQLKALGNGVVPQQAVLALRILLNDIRTRKG